jgi:branched-chain amino acid transport system permease protein
VSTSADHDAAAAPDTLPSGGSRDRRSVSKVLGWPQPQPVTIGAVLLLAAAVPLVLDNRYWMGILTLMLVWVVLNHGWNLVLGFAGVWNFGLLAIYGIGGYTAALLSLHTSLPALLSVFAGGLVAAAAALVLAVPSLRLRGIYVSLLTFSFAEVIRLLVISDRLGWTGGSFGLSGFDGWGFAGMDPAQRIRVLYWIALVAVLLSTAVMLLVARSPLGTGLTALRDNPALASARGIGLKQYQFLAFGLSGFMAGCAGALFAFNYGVISPSVMGLIPMTLLITMLVIGGLGTVTGPILGTLLIAVIQARLEEWPTGRPIILGLILLVAVLMAPGGIVPMLSRVRARLESWMEADDNDAADEPEEDSGDTEQQSLNGPPVPGTTPGSGTP